MVGTPPEGSGSSSATTPAGAAPGPNGRADPVGAETDDDESSVLHPRLTAENVELRRRIAELDAKVEAAEGQVRHYAASYDRARTEFGAARDRIAREQERTLKREKASAVSGLLGVLDSFDRSLDAVRDGGASAAFVDGVRMIRQQFEKALQDLGLARFDGAGERFDPARHQAAASLPVLDPSQDGIVLQSLGAGAMVGEEVVRPATVIVGRFASDADAASAVN